MVSCLSATAAISIGITIIISTPDQKPSHAQGNQQKLSQFLNCSHHVLPVRLRDRRAL
jgi:hypothetical protein